MRESPGSETHGKSSLWRMTSLEIEASDLEWNSSRSTAAPPAKDGTLTNFMPGGENPASAELVIDLGEDFAKEMHEYYDSRQFQKLSRHDQEHVARQLRQPTCQSSRNSTT